MWGGGGRKSPNIFKFIIIIFFLNELRYLLSPPTLLFRLLAQVT